MNVRPKKHAEEQVGHKGHHYGLTLKLVSSSTCMRPKYTRQTILPRSHLTELIGGLTSDRSGRWAAAAESESGTKRGRVPAYNCVKEVSSPFNTQTRDSSGICSVRVEPRQSRHREQACTKGLQRPGGT